MKFIVQQGRHAQQHVASPSRWKGLPHSQLTTRISCAMMPAMEIDSYWRTRTIAEARAQS